jgi:hypothetical protein
MGGHRGRSDVAKEPHKDSAEVARCFLYSAFDAVLSCSASRPITFTFFVRQVPNANFSSPLSVTRDFLSTAGCSSAEFGACLFLAFIGPGLEASPIRFPSKPVHVSVELDFDRSFGIFDMNVVVQIDNKINAKSFETIGVKIKKINNVKNKRLLVRHERG